MTTHNDYYLDVLGVQRWLPRAQEESNTTDWDGLQREVSQCRACQLCESRTQTVFGIGNQQADLLIVGEAPGANEDLQGEPFVGRAGKLLDKMLQAIGLDRSQVYIANVLKCRPPSNRDPLPEEIRQCTPFLEQQVALLQPKIILAVGKVAAHYLLETNASLASMRQQEHRFRETSIPLFVSYHPAYLLRKPSDKPKAYADLLKILEKLHG